jgi:D-lactate dehydrogenase
VESINRLVRFLHDMTSGDNTIVVDTSPCSYTLRHCGPDLEPDLREKYQQLKIIDGIELAEHVAKNLEVRTSVGPVVLHPVCSAVKMDLVESMKRVVEPFCSDVVVPEAAGCCGFAGDRGFLVPELTESATLLEADEVKRAEFDGFFSSSRSCEIGMTRATGKPYRSFWHLLDEASR